MITQISPKIGSRSFAIKRLYANLRLPLLLLISAGALSIRIDDFSYIEQSLWYEDGLVYITQASESGLRSLWITLGGYQILYNRIVALIAIHLPLVATPYIYVIAWLLAFSSIILVLTIRGKLVGIDGWLATFFACAIALQPNHGEPFFNLNHSYFFLGIALALYACIPTRKPISHYEAVFLVIACLSGPFSAIMLPLMLLQMVILRDFFVRRTMYLIFFTCGLIQCFYLASWRLSSITAEDPARWLHALSGFIFFGQSGNLVQLTATCFWTTTLIYLFRWVRYKRTEVDDALWLPPPLAALAVIGFFCVCVSSSAYFLPSLGPLDMGARYFLIPYSLTFFIAIACTKQHGSALTAVIAMISVICATAPLTVDREDRSSTTGLLSHVNMQWTAFVKFHSIKPDILIPINASLPMYPPVHARTKNAGNGAKNLGNVDGPILLYPQHDRPSSLVAHDRQGAVTIPPEQGPSVYFDIRSYCPNSKYLALEIDIWRSRMGWASVYWGHLAGFSSERSLRRFYPSGAVTMQFAFRRRISDDIVRFYPAEGVADSPVVRTVNLPWMRRPGTIMAEPTRPGGELKVSEARLYCLE